MSSKESGTVSKTSTFSADVSVYNFFFNGAVCLWEAILKGPVHEKTMQNHAEGATG